MRELTEVTEIDASPETVWEAIHDYRKRLEWDVMLRRVAVDGEDPNEAGVIDVGTVVTQWARWSAGGVMLAARYDVHEPPTSGSNGRASISMVEGPWFFREFTADVRLEPTESGGTRCLARYRFAVRPAALRWIAEPIVVWMFMKETNARWHSLRRYLQRPAVETETAIA